MNKKDFKKQFINEFKQENTPTTSFNDVFKEQPKEENTYYKKYLSLNRKFKLSIAFSCIMLLVLIIGLSTSLIYLKDNHGKYDDMFLEHDDIEYFSSICDRINAAPYAIIQVCDDQYIGIYSGVSKRTNEDYINYYFYKIFNFSISFNIYLTEYDNIIFIHGDNLSGLLLQINGNYDIKFSIIINNLRKDYIL